MGQWQHQLKTADFRQVINLAVPALEKQTKDLQIAAWLAREQEQGCHSSTCQLVMDCCSHRPSHVVSNQTALFEPYQR